MSPMSPTTIMSTRYPEEEIKTGLGKAVDEFLQAHQGVWSVCAHYENNNGLTVLERRGAA